MNLLYFILNTLQYILLIYIGISSLYFFLYAFAAQFSRKKVVSTSDKKHKFLVLIPGYKEDQVIVDVATEALKQDYPKDLYDIIVIADSFKLETLNNLKKLPIIVNEVSFEVSSKSKSINATLAAIPNNKYNAIMILDADNIMESNVLSLMNEALNSGYSAVQGHRVAKNTDMPFARLDAISEEINNCIFRRGHRALGVSSALIGSGMAFEYNIYKNYMATIDSYGEDKELEFKLMKDNIKIEFIDEAWIYDEKVSASKVFVRQRTRWLFNQILYARLYFFEGVKLLLTKGNFDFFDKMFQQFLPPRILLIGISFLSALGSFFYNSIELTYIFVGIFISTIAAFSMAVPKRFYNFKTMKVLLLLPKGFVLMIMSLLRLQEAKKGFGATTHTVTKINNDKNNN